MGSLGFAGQMSIGGLKVKNGLIRLAIGLCCASVLLWSTGIAAQSNEKGDWNMPGGDPGQSGWQKAESKLGPDSVAANVKFLWKIKLGQLSKTGRSFSEPLLASRLINAQGFKDIVYWSSSDTVYAVDSELGTLIWKKQFNTPVPATVPGCSASSLSLLTEPPPVINFNARRRTAPGTPRPPEPPPTQSIERRLGVAPGGGYFGLKGMYVLTADGMLHEQVINTGADFAPPVRFLPAANGSPSGLNIVDHTIYAATGRGCGGVPNGLWAIDLASSSYPVASYATPEARPLALTGPVVAPDGTSFIVTGAGTPGSNADVHAGSVVAVSKNMKVQDWYTPNGAMASYQGVSPVTFKYKEKQLLVAPGRDGSLALLDAASLGGADHHTPLFETPSISNPGEKHDWDGFASWQDKDGTQWVFASVSAGIPLDDSAIKSNGPTPHGGVAAFRIEESNGQVALRPVWVSRDMVNPAPPRVANGVVIALSGGDARTHATLYLLNAATGAELYSSENQIPTFTQLSGVSVGDGHAFFTDHNNVLYSFGIALEH
jgi:outer membrane protein assembly factor BamB